MKDSPLAMVFVAVVLALPHGSARGEVIEEIVARVNDDIITRSELQQVEHDTIEEILAKGGDGEGVEKQLAKAKTEILRDLITKKILVQQAERLYDLAKMQDAFIRQFKEQQKITSNSELEKILKDEGMTLDEFKRKLIEINAPSSVIDLEVRSKLAVSDAEIEKYYKEHQADLASPSTASFREIVLLIGEGTKEDVLARGRAIAARARGGGNFVELARESSQVESGLRGGLVGPFKKGELAPELEAAVFSMKPGETSEPIVVGEAVHIVRLASREESAAPSLEAMKDKISEAVEREKFAAGVQEYVLKLWSLSEIWVADEYVPRLAPEFRKYVKG